MNNYRKEIAMQLTLENHEASLMFRILKNRASELKREIARNEATNEVEYLKHKEAILSNLLVKLGDIDEFAHMKGFKGHQEI